MPYKEHIIEKIYWPIGKVAHEVGIAVSVITFWEKKGLIFPKKYMKHSNFRTKNKRVYGIAEIKRLRTINTLRRLGVSIDRIRKALNQRYAQELAQYLSSKDEQN